MVNYIKDKSYQRKKFIKTVETVYVKINRDKSLKTLGSDNSIFRINPKYSPRRYDTYSMILPASQANKIIDENHEKEHDKDNESKTTDITDTKNQIKMKLTN